MEFYCEYYRSSVAYKAAISMPIILQNGRRVFGPRKIANAAIPTHRCELYVARIPSQLDELGFLVWLHRIGQVYEFRLMMNSCISSRGYAYIRFTKEREALAGLEMLKHLFINGERLQVSPSEGKNRLFLSCIPRHIPISLLEESLKLYFPKMHRFAACRPVKEEMQGIGQEKVLNRGFAFVEFADHEDALEAKKRFTPCRVRMWGADLKVQWAKPKEEKSRGSMAYRDFSTNNNVKDDCCRLRLYCLANNWSIPVILYGRSFRSRNLQYGGILIKNIFSGLHSIIIVEINVTSMSDIHLLLCELAVQMIERHSAIPPYSYIIRACSNTKAELVHLLEQNDDLYRANLEAKFFSFTAIRELLVALQLIAAHNSKIVLNMYKRAFLTHNPVATFCLDSNHPLGQFYAILPKFRNNPKLNNDFNDMEINLLLKVKEDVNTTDSVIEIKTINEISVKRAIFKAENLFLKSQKIPKIKHQHYVDIEALISKECYDTQQYINSNPVWIAGQTYQDAVYN
uniref:RRM domain-containing protein n=1 Tax=Glossina palpalis gambiensis TaxID=67801 RepID=A0A1B0BIV3_9MUSC